MRRTVILEVIDRNTKVPLLQSIILEEDQKDYEGEYEFLYKVKSKYLNMLNNEIKYKPSVKKIIDGIDWCIEGVVV